MFGIEAGVSNGWERYLDLNNFIGMSTFGESDTYESFTNILILLMRIIEKINKTL